MFLRRGGLYVDVYINYGDDRIRHERARLPEGSTVLQALMEVAEVEFTPDDSATGHSGSMVISIDQTRSDINFCWIYYVFEPEENGWRLPSEMPDRHQASNGMRIGWRYYPISRGLLPKEGPLWSSRCATKVRTCSRKFG